MKTYIIAILLIVSSVTTFAQKERKYIRKGNKLYEKAAENSDSTKVDTINYANAEVEYRKALEKKPNNYKAQFNIGDALFKQKKMAEASTQFEEALMTSTMPKEDKSKAYFNYGNSLLAQQKLEESIEAYKNALRNNPKDLEAKYNLEFARKMKQQQDQQKQKQDQNKDQDKNKDKQDQDKDKDKQDQNKDQQDQKKDQEQQQKQQPQPKISKQNAEQMLKALQNDEKNTQEKVKKLQAEQSKSSNPDIDW